MKSFTEWWDSLHPDARTLLCAHRGDLLNAYNEGALNAAAENDRVRVAIAGAMLNIESICRQRIATGTGYDSEIHDAARKELIEHGYIVE